MPRIVMAIALGLTACAPIQPIGSGYEDASITQADELNCRKQASAAATRACEIFGYHGHAILCWPKRRHCAGRAGTIRTSKRDAGGVSAAVHRHLMGRQCRDAL
jgi:hypothetical protein